MHTRAPIPLLLFLVLTGVPHALNQEAPNITYNSADPCPAWTAWVPEHIDDVRLTDMGYVRQCQNVTYVSYCVPGPVFINYSQARHYTSIDCSAKDFCQGWTRFYPETEKNLTSRTPDNLTRTCVNTTFVSWCIRAYSNIDYRTGRRYSEVNCGAWVEACSYKAGPAVARSENNGAYCRPCNVTAYQYACNYGGKITLTPAPSQSVCGAWAACPAAYYVPPSASSPSLSTVSLDSPNVLIALLLGVGLTVLLVLVLVFSHRSD